MRRPNAGGPVAVDSNGDSNRAEQGEPKPPGNGSTPDVRDVRGRDQTMRPELTSERSKVPAVAVHYVADVL
ncbi:hypothetical protein Jiend_04130 [Micromonospora endophytica]|nr:hypothetical protein Jiend_04130 [Micromonospora endophytica]